MEKIINYFFNDLKKEKVTETFSKYEAVYSCHNISNFAKKLNDLNYKNLNLIYENYNCKWDLYIEDYNYSISQGNFKPLDLDDEDEDNLYVIFQIHKGNQIIPIISSDEFEKSLSSMSLNDILSTLKNLLFPIHFIGNDFNFTLGKYPTSNDTFISKLCNFRSQTLYNFSPENFQIENKKNNLPEYFNLILLKIKFIYSLIYIYSTSEINDNKIELIISGYKTSKYTLDFHNFQLDIDSVEEYLKIYRWIYSEKNRVNDKIGISRNILTAYLGENNTEIKSTVFTSILSSYLIYIKGNISKYFEVRNKIISQIEQTINGVNKSLDSFVNNFQKSTFVFISFFLSIFIFKVVNKSSLDRIFNKETSLLGIGFIIISFLYLIASLIILALDKSRLKERYENVKDRYKDVLVQEDIEKILNDDSEYKNEIKHLENRILTYTLIWLLSLVTFLIVLFFASEYLSLELNNK